MGDNESFANYLGVDYEKKGNLVRINCPFHNDSHPSFVLYPELERGGCCFACGETASWAWLATHIKGITYRQALEDLGQETLEPSAVRNTIKAPSPMSFCEEPNPKFVEAFEAKYAQCHKNYPDFVTKWLEKKCLLDPAKKLGWKWHQKGIFRHWGDGIVIPYHINGKVAYVRFRGLETAYEGDAVNSAVPKFAKPKGPMDVGIQPYYNTFRPNDTVFIVEGECLTPDTEVLTKQGWVRFDEYDGHSEVAQWEDGRIEYVVPKVFLVKEHVNGRIYEYHGRGISFATTPKHRVLGFRGGWDNMKQIVEKAEDFYPKRTDRKLPCVGDADGGGLDLTDAQIKLAVAVSADFSERKYSWYCTLAKERKRSRLNELLETAGVKYKKYGQNTRGQWGWQIWEKPWWLRKEFDHTWLAKMSLHQKKVMLEEFVHWDGNRVKNRKMTQYSTISYQNAVFVQTLAHLSGVRATIIKRHGDTNFKENFTWYVVHILWGSKYVSLQNYHNNTEIKMYSGKVYCVSVPSTFFLIRHKGHICVTGNTDAASVWSHGMSAIGLPGACAKKAINSAAAFIADHLYIKRVVCCGDNDPAGQKMNQLVRQSLLEFEVKAEIVLYNVESPNEKADLNDDHVAGLFKPPAQWGMSYKDNYNRNFPGDDFGDFVDKFSDFLGKCDEHNYNPWQQAGNIEVLNRAAEKRCSLF